MAVPRKVFTNERDGWVADRAEKYIAKQKNGAGTWPDEAIVDLPTVTDATLVICDKIEGDRTMRHVEVKLDGTHLVVTLVYSHDTRALVRTF